MKSRTRPLRLGSFEQLESRALLANSGMNFLVLNLGEQGPVQFLGSREFRHEPAQQSFSPEVRGDLRMRDQRDAGPRGQIADITVTQIVVIPEQTAYSQQQTAYSQQQTAYSQQQTVIVFINIPAPATSQQQYSAPGYSNTGSNSGRGQSLVAPAANFANSMLSSNSSPRNATARTTMDAVSIATGLSLQRTDSDNGPVDEEQTTDSSSDQETATRNANERDARPTLPERNVAAEEAEAADEEAELIELSAEEAARRGKRKIVRTSITTVSESASLVNSALRVQRQSDRSQPLQAEIWLQAAASEADYSPVSDDLIELIANESIDPAQPHTPRPNSFEADGVIPIEATIGYFRATETESEQSAEPAQPAAVAAALPVPAGN